ncbi:Nucleolar complex protein 3 [Orchesella cincta]|uniref:NOC3-like protein n=1 Tax=Orchesella cincta TaxID=48709 RepID=A0A1D2N6K0_ORCCI|nr:Nucleolar complex protein 3 [Orchesella cincta]
MIPEEDLPHLRKENFRNTFYLVGKGKSGGQESDSWQRKKGKKQTEEDVNDDLELEYEEKFMQAKERMAMEKTLLPIKTKKGFHYPTAPVQIQEVEVTETPATKPTKKTEGLDSDDEYENAPEVTTAMLLARRNRKLGEYKVRIGVLSSAFLEDPENRLQNLEGLLAFMDTKEASVSLFVRKIAALSLQAIFKDVLPLYPIKHTTGDGVKLKKDTRQLQSYEAGLLKKYRMYMQKLEKFVTQFCPKRAKNNLSEAESKLGKIALMCMCRMLESHPYFNLSVNIVNFIVPMLNHWCAAVRESVTNTIKTIFRIDKRGEISYEVVRRINILIKSKFKSGSGHIRKDVLDVLLALRIKEADLEKEKEEEANPGGRKMTFEQRKMLSKRQRKKAKELVQLEKELLEASAEESKSRKSHFLTEITKSVFTIYFRALKTSPRSQILSSVLEGLSKFAHVINIDYFGDLLKVLQGILSDHEVQERQFLLCISTVLAVLDGQGSALTMDPAAFHKHLYNCLINLRCGKLQSNTGLALRCVRLASGRKKLPAPRAVAFAKRLATLALQVEHHDAVATVQQLKHVMRLHPNCSVLLDCEGAGASGVYLPELEDPDHCCAQSSTLWEVIPLMSHYHPWVSTAAMGVIESEKSMLPGQVAQMSPELIADSFDTLDMEFTPKLRTPNVDTKPRKYRPRSIIFKPKTEYFAQFDGMELTKPE